MSWGGRWEHEHRFREAARGAGGPLGTWVKDRATSRLPLGPLRRLAHRLLVRRQLDAIFAHRRERLVEGFGGEPVP